MSRPKIKPNQVDAAGTTAGQILTSDGTNAAFTTPTPKLDALPNGTAVSGSKVFASAGDANGVFYFLGTQLGASTWGNPQTTAQIVAVRSTNGAGTVADIFDRTTNATYTDGGALGDFIFVDLGVNRSLVPNYYSLRNYNQPNREMRTWKLQGTNSVAGTSVAQINAATWTDLDVRSGDTTMSGASAWANYTPNQSNTTAFRYLRILQTGTDATGGPYICVAEWELYGTFNYTSSALVDGRLVQVDGTGGNDVRQTAFSAVGGTLSSTGDVTITSAATNGNVTLTPTGTGSITLNGPITASALDANVQTFASSGTWTKPAGAKVVEVLLLGAGAGAGGGQKVSGANGAGGGSGGGGGAYSRAVFRADDLGATETVTVGAGGGGGAGRSTDGIGNNGANGGDSTFGTWLKAGGGQAGSGGNVPNGQNGGTGGSVLGGSAFSSTTGALSGQGGGVASGAVPRAAEFGGGAGGGYSDANASYAGASSIWGGPGGGHGGFRITGTDYAPSAGGTVRDYSIAGGGGAAGSNGASGGTAGSAGAAPSISLAGTGGGGGGGTTTTGNGANGGNGGRAAGGGGGGFCNSTGNSGAGGNGGNGLVIVITYK
jgi:hypothetical protein